MSRCIHGASRSTCDVCAYEQRVTDAAANNKETQDELLALKKERDKLRSALRACVLRLQEVEAASNEGDEWTPGTLVVLSQAEELLR